MDAKAFAAKHGLSLETVRVFGNPNASENWPVEQHWRHWQFRLSTKDGRHMIGFFSQGAAHKKPPTMADVLDCLRSDAFTLQESRGFYDWCMDTGFDTDSRTAERTYQTITAQTDIHRAAIAKVTGGQ